MSLLPFTVKIPRLLNLAEVVCGVIWLGDSVKSINMFDIVSFIHNNLSDVLPVAQNVATGVLAAVFFRRKNRIETDTQEFAKLKAGRLDEATEMLINSGQLSYTELYKMKNYYDIAKKADEYLKVKEIDTQNFDWHTRFLRHVEILAMRTYRKYGRAYLLVR